MPRTSSLRSGILTMWKSSPYSSYASLRYFCCCFHRTMQCLQFVSPSGKSSCGRGVGVSARDGGGMCVGLQSTWLTQMAWTSIWYVVSS